MITVGSIVAAKPKKYAGKKKTNKKCVNDQANRSGLHSKQYLRWIVNY